MNQEDLTLLNNNVSPQVALLWNKIPLTKQQLILNNVYCVHCCVAVTMGNVDGCAEGASLVLKGLCNVCGGKVARVIEELD